VFRLANEDQSSTIDLLSGTLKLRDQQWTTRTPALNLGYTHTPFGAQPQFNYLEPVVETIGLVAQASVSSVLSAVNEIESALESVRRYFADPLYDESWWLEWNLDGESAKRSLLYRGNLQFPTGVGYGPFAPDGFVARLSLTRHPLWESPSESFASSSGVSTLGGFFTLSSIGGTAPARPRFRVYGNSVTLCEFWLGWQPVYTGTSSLDTVWELETQDNGGDTYYHHSDCDDATALDASNGYYTECDFGSDASMAIRTVTLLKDVVASNYSHFAGRWLVLLRARCDASTVAGVRIKINYTNSDYSQFMGETVYIDGSTAKGQTWSFYEMGEAQFPPMGSEYLTDYALKHIGVVIEAERVSGNGSLEMDCLVLVPAAHMIHVTGADSSSSSMPIEMQVLPDDRPSVVGYDSDYVKLFLDLSTREPYIPTGDVLFGLAGQGEQTQWLTVTTDVLVYYYERWKSYRS